MLAVNILKELETLFDQTIDQNDHEIIYIKKIDSALTLQLILDTCDEDATIIFKHTEKIFFSYKLSNQHIKCINNTILLIDNLDDEQALVTLTPHVSIFQKNFLRDHAQPPQYLHEYAKLPKLETSRTAYDRISFLEFFDDEQTDPQATSYVTTTNHEMRIKISLGTQQKNVLFELFYKDIVLITLMLRNIDALKVDKQVLLCYRTSCIDPVLSIQLKPSFYLSYYQPS